MPEPPLYFAVPFVSLEAAGVDWRRALFASVVALTPDLDLLFHVHRSQTHSVVVLVIIVLPILALVHKNRTVRGLLLLGATGLTIPLVLDLFGSSTPLFWPLLNEPLLVSFEPLTFFDEPILTAEGLGISSLLLIPSLVKTLKARMRQ